MGKEENEDELDVVVVEYGVPMHCNACERDVANIISKYHGVETFTTDMNTHKVVVTGQVDPQKLLKKLKKKTGKKVEILAKEKDEEDDNIEENNNNNNNNNNGALQGISNLHPMNVGARPCFFGDCEESKICMFIFSEENPNACSIM